ncbi:MAG: sigma 54-interacting transcriptional regulator [Desulfuromonadales bacterium]|nr:sigma 54-interacting transcriptional regulator [Desulfuromonadales bacterium]MDW7758181.1 sigma 54-interacting transcriptional regulator [Desulfuromonadales bacterium]
MTNDKDHKPLRMTNQLRRQAEEQLRAKTAAKPPPLSLNEAQRLLHELEVHQIELEMQNAELRSARHELEIAHTKYAELFDFAPLGYFILDQRGRIQEVNLAGAQLLGIERGLLTGKALSRFIEEAEGRAAFSDHLEKVVGDQGVQCCELNLRRPDNTRFHGLLQSAAVEASEILDGRILTSIVDDTDNRALRLKLQQAQAILEETVAERTAELTKANAQLVQEIEEHKRAKESLKGAFSQIQKLSERLQAENVHLQQEVSREYDFGEIIGHSDAMSYVFFRVEQVAPQDATVLLLGETGTGKGLIARAIHSRSARKDRPMITVNCTALPANLIESELFGREKGAFTGAHARQMGRFELADGGTIFLDEIGEMPLELQCKLLRVLQDGEFERLGSPRTVKVDVRIIAASNRDLEEEIRAGRFREDLFYRLSVFPITIPPLRQRKDDIPLLIRYFIAKYNRKIGKKIETVSKETLGAFEQYHWPGNVRELENVIERAVITSQGPVLQVLDHFDAFQRSEEEQDLKSLGDLERDHIVQVLQKTGWRIEGAKGAALLLDINPSTLRARMRKYGIRR